MILFKLSQFIKRLNLKDGIHTHSQFGTFKITNGKLDIK